ncbi:DUF2798 domain-containing protein [Dasania marina]|uniref:DUF2798 domain-containing protein n=1 Tax=Dasania marina TaxID=471499 RepID=UPI0030DA167D
MNIEMQQRPLYQKLLVIAALITVVGGTLTGIMTYMNVGYTETFMVDWLSSFAITALVMAPAGFIFMTLVGRLVQLAMPKGEKMHQQLVTGLLMALIMEPVMAISTTANTIGFADPAQFVAAWQQALLAALPFGLVMAVTMALFLKPRLDKFMAG